MAQIRVTAAQLKNAATELRAKNVRFKSEVENMEATENSLNGMWEGEAKNAFHTAFTTDKGKMDVFSQEIEKYAQALETIAQKYEEAENQSINIAGTRSY